jgi:hypothetical protein
MDQKAAKIKGSTDLKKLLKAYSSVLDRQRMAVVGLSRSNSCFRLEYLFQ